MQTYDLLKFALAKSNGSSLLLITQYEMPFINKSEATKRSKERKMYGKCTINGTNRRSRVWPVCYFLSREPSFLLNCGKITSIQGYVNIGTARLFCPVAIIVASKYKVLLNGSLLFKDRSWGTDNNCPSHYTAEVSQEQAGSWRGLQCLPSVSKDYRASAAHDIRTRATSSNLARVWKWGWNVNRFVKKNNLDFKLL